MRNYRRALEINTCNFSPVLLWLKVIIFCQCVSWKCLFISNDYSSYWCPSTDLLDVWAVEPWPRTKVKAIAGAPISGRIIFIPYKRSIIIGSKPGSWTSMLLSQRLFKKDRIKNEVNNNRYSCHIWDLEGWCGWSWLGPLCQGQGPRHAATLAPEIRSTRGRPSDYLEAKPVILPLTNRWISNGFPTNERNLFWF